MQEITELREIQLIGVGILEKLAVYLEGKNIPFYLAWGTLLGAARHQGFIPWDDDIDVAMLREDYELFARQVAQDGIASELDVFIPTVTPGYSLPNIRVCDKRTIVEIENQSRPVDQGIWVTIFPLDKMPAASFPRWLFDLRTRFLCSVIYNLQTDTVAAGSFFRRFVKNTERLLYPPRSLPKIARKADKVFKKYQGAGHGALSILTTLTSKRKLFRREWFETFVPLEFEGKTYPAPGGYKQVLSALYGDYMSPPPPEARSPKHNYRAFWKQ